MIPSWRLLGLLLLGIIPVVAAATNDTLWGLVLVYILIILAALSLDWRLTPKPSAIDVARINEAKLSLGAYNKITLAVHNTSQRPLNLTLRDEYPPEFPADATLLSTTLEPEAVEELIYHVRPLKRGDYQFGRINLRYDSVLKLFQRQAEVPFEELVKVYPNILETRKYDMLARRGLLNELGLRTSRLYGSGTEFERLRDYTPDDEFRRINWRATARRNKLITAEYETERAQHIICILDTGRLMRPPIGQIAKLDYAINTALLLAYVATLKGDYIGMLSFADHPGRFLSPRRGKHQFYQMLEMLYNLPSQPVESDYGRAMAYLSLKNKRRSLLLIFTDLSTTDAARPLIEHLGRLAKTHVVMCVVMSDPNVIQHAGQPILTDSHVYERAVAEMLLDERQLVLDTLQQAGVYTVDVPADKLSIAVINKYLELKGRAII